MFRKWEPNDLEPYLAMARVFYQSDAVLFPVPESHFAATFDEAMRSDAYAEGYMLLCEKEIAGYALLAKTFSQESGGRTAFIEELYVKPAYQGRGLGSEFLAYMDERLQQGEFKRLRLEVEAENEGATRLYERSGFRKLDYLQLYKGK